MTFIQVENLSKQFAGKATLLPFAKSKGVRAVDDVSFGIEKGTTYALVGESGSGKSTIANLIVGLLKPTAGKVLIEGQDLFGANFGKAEELAVRRRLQMVFQSPFRSLNPRWRVGDIVAEPIKFFKLYDQKSQVPDLVVDVLEQVGLTATDMRRYPHEFSGGQRQRISIARALASKPEFIVCDEVTSALDVSVQAQVLNLLKRLQKELGLSYLFITHDLAVVASMADHIGVLKGGKLVEESSARDLLTNPQHAYTQDLLASAPTI